MRWIAFWCAPKYSVTAHLRLRLNLNPIRFGTASNLGNEIAVASDVFNGTLLTSLSLLYEYALSFLFSLDHDRRLLVDNRLGAKPAEHDAATAFSDHE